MTTEALGGRQMQIFVGSVGVGVGPQDTRHHEFRAGETVTEHLHKGNAPALPHHGWGAGEYVTRNIRQDLPQPRGQSRGMPARPCALALDRYLAAVGRV